MSERRMFMDRPPDIDLGDDHLLWFFQWSPDRELNPQYADLPDVERAGAIVSHFAPDGSDCMSSINFDLPAMRRVFPKESRWQVQSWEPLTLSPSLLCRAPLEGGGECRDHGFIRAGRWVRA